MTETRWMKARIKPQQVEVRRVEDPAGEIIEAHDGPRRVRIGDVIVRMADGKLASCSTFTFDRCYTLLE